MFVSLFLYACVFRKSLGKLGGEDVKTALDKLEAKWLDKLQPYGDKGYNREKRR
ncbi:hypothetical protein GCM10027018_15690 [Paenibacillus thermoaerophilus]